jgi:hypothetical protein
MWNWFTRGRASPAKSSENQALKGAPVHARMKTYSADTGYVYQYVYRGYRPMTEGGGMEHVFEASRGGGQRFHVRIHLLDPEVEQCIRALGRELIGAERYALVKMSLFAALDEFTDLAQFETPLAPNAGELEGHLRTLGRI